MSDNIRLVPAEETKMRPSLLHRWVVFLLLFLAVVIFLSIFLLSNSTSLDGIKRFFRYFGTDRESYGQVTFRNEAAISGLVEDCLWVGTADTVTLYAQDGALQKKLTGGYASPAIKTCGELLLCYDLGGTRLALFGSDGEQKQTFTAELPIYDAGLAADGSVCVLTEGRDCHAALSVYDAGGELRFRHFSKTYYLNCCALSPDGDYVAVTAMGQTDAVFSSTVQIFATNEAKIQAEVPLGDQVCYQLFFLEEDTLCAAGEHSLVFMEKNGTPLREFVSERGSPVSCRYAEDGYVCVLLDMYESEQHYSLVSLSADGTVINTLQLDQTPQSIHVCGQYVAVLTEQKLKLLNRELKLQNQANNQGWQTAFARSDGTAYCLTSGEAKIYIP